MTENLLDQQDDTIFDPSKDYLSELVGEGKKFASEKDLAAGKVQADLFIKHLTQEQKELRSEFQRLQDEYKTTASLKELVDQLKQPAHANLNVNTDNREPLTQFTPEKAKELFSEQLQQYELSKKQETNYNLVKSKLEERYGNTFPSAVKQQIESLGITEARFNDMVRNEPQVLIRALGLDQPVRKDSFEAPPRNNQRSDSFAPTSGSKRTWSFYEKMRIEKPDDYRNPKTQVQMHKDVLAIGEKAFYDHLS